MYSRLSVATVRYKRSLLLNRSEEAKKLRITEKVLKDSLKTLPISATVSGRKPVSEKHNKWGLKVRTTKVDERNYEIDPQWKDLPLKFRDHKLNIMRAAGKEPVGSKKRIMKFDGGRLTGDSIYNGARLPRPAQTGMLLDDLRTGVKIADELKEVRELLDVLMNKVPAHWDIPTDEFKIVGVQKIRRDLIIARLSSSKEKRRKDQILNNIEDHIHYFNNPISDFITERTVGRKHRLRVVFDWIKKDHYALGDESLLAKGHTPEEHDKAIRKLNEMAQAEREEKRRNALNYELNHNLIESPDEHLYLMPETELDKSSYLQRLDGRWNDNCLATMPLGIDNDYLLSRIEHEINVKKDWYLAYCSRLEKVKHMGSKDISFDNVIQLTSTRSEVVIED